MNRNQAVYRLVLAALLVAIGIIIPMTFPKITLPLMSFTLASHVAIFLAMFLAPSTAVIVALGTTLGFFLSGLPLEVTLRALSHVVGSLWILKRPQVLKNRGEAVAFCVGTNLIHAVMELIVISALFLGGFERVVNNFSEAGYMAILLLVGLGTLVHGSVDFIISFLVWQPLKKVPGLSKVASAK